MYTKDKEIAEIKVRYFLGNCEKGYDYVSYEPSIGMYEIMLNGKIGFADGVSGEQKIEAIYDVTFTTDGKIVNYIGADDYIFVKLNGLLGVIRKNGEQVTEFKWQNAIYWGNDIVAMLLPFEENSKNEKWIFMNLETGKQYNTLPFSTMKDLGEGFLEVAAEKKKFCAVFSFEKNQVLTEFKYFEVLNYINGQAPASILSSKTSEALWGLIDENGKQIIKHKYAAPFYLLSGFAIVSKPCWQKDPFNEGDFYTTKKVLINWNGTELVNSNKDYWKSIKRIGINIFVLQRKKRKKTIYSIRQYFKYGDMYTIVIEDGQYMYVSKDDSGNCTFINISLSADQTKINGIGKIEYMYMYAKIYYIGGGTIYLLDKKGKKVSLSQNNERILCETNRNHTRTCLEKLGIEISFSN